MVGCVIEFVCKGLMNRAIAMSGQIINALVADSPCPLLSAKRSLVHKQSS
jgi:hypothetical protein